MYAAPLFINGEHVERTSADRLLVVNPATEAALGDVPAAGASEVEAALAAAQRGFEAWRRKTPWERSTVLRKIALLMRERSADIARLLTLEVGKPLAESVTEERGFFFAPTILAGLPADAAVLNDEPFGPIAAIVPVAGIDDAIRHANALEFGLAAYLFTRSRDAIDQVTGELQAGAIGVNTTVVALPEAPFGGVKQSGFGREGGEDGMREYLNPKFVHQMRA